jgi:hypothetical protein
VDLNASKEGEKRVSMKKKKKFIEIWRKKKFWAKKFFFLLCLENPIYKRCEIEAKKDKYRKVLYW